MLVCYCSMTVALVAYAQTMKNNVAIVERRESFVGH